MKISYRYILSAACMLFPLSFTSSAQDTIKAPPKHKNHDIFDRMDFGGYLGAQFGDVTYIEVSPVATYHITQKFHTGLGLTYQYFHYSDPYSDYTSNSYGGSIFARYFVWRDLFAHVEYAPLYITNFVYPPYFNPEGKAPWAHDVLIGGGYRQWIGERAYVGLMLLFNINETIYSPYSNPIIRIGFGVGI